MTREEQANFVMDLMGSVQNEILANINKEVVPIEWDGFELRQYIADKFAREVYIKMTPRRKSAYRNTLLVTNL